MSLKTIAQSAIAAAALAVVTFTGTSLIGPSEAEAHHRHRHFRVHHGIYVTPFIAAGIDGRPCHWLKVRAQETGSRYWYNRYYECRGFY